MTLAYIPPTIGGLILCYRGRLLWGGAVTALFTAMQVLSNHVQMTYYFLFVMGLIVVAYGIQALRRKDDGLGNGVLSPKRWLKATGVIVVAGILGVAANLPNLYHTYDYAKHTMRGGSELTPLPAAKQSGDGAEASKGGLNYDYITQWSYGVDETMTLLIPNFKGGEEYRAKVVGTIAVDLINSGASGMLRDGLDSVFTSVINSDLETDITKYDYDEAKPAIEYVLDATSTPAQVVIPSGVYDDSKMYVLDDSFVQALPRWFSMDMGDDVVETSAEE